MTKAKLSEQLNLYEEEKQQIENNIRILNSRLARYTKKEERAVRFMKNYFYKGLVFLFISLSSFLFPGLFNTIIAASGFTFSVFCLFAVVFQSIAYKKFKRFNIHSIKLYNKSIAAKENIILKKQKILKEINNLNNQTTPTREIETDLYNFEDINSLAL